MAKVIKVLHTEWSDGWGGQEIRIINEMIAVREQGVEVFLACRDCATIKQKAIENNIKVSILPFKGNVDIKTLFGLKRIIKEHNINIVNTHSGKDTWVGGMAAKLSGIKFIRTRHLSNPINPARTNFINELADYIFTTGESVRENMIKFNRISPEKIRSIPTGIDSDLFDPRKFDRDLCRRKYNLNNEDIAIGIVAVLRDSKRHDNFLKIANGLKKDFPKKKFKFFIAGEGPIRDVVESTVNKLSLTQDVVLLGHIENVPELMKALDIFLFTADRWEGVPQSVMQALMMDVSTVSTNDGSTSDLHKENNFLISDPDFNKVYDNTKQMVKNLSNDKFLNKSRSFIVDNFSKKVATIKILETYKTLVK
ncbi:glycosyltransferase [Candidatus Woesearchaeota archaeon]|nr:glycosyltransferase [Candidatus Woesearchaeota archaeon]